MISHYTKISLSECNGSWVVSIKLNVNFKFQLPDMFVFLFFRKSVCIKLFILWPSIRIQNFMVLPWLVQVLHPPQKFERPLFWNGWSYGIKNYGFEVTSNGMLSLLNFIKICQFIQEHVISLTYIFPLGREVG
jgi:hypothetical protein